jgi:hypothetical protein
MAEWSFLTNHARVLSISCDRGVYRWHMRAWFTSSKTTYWSTSSPFYMAGV